MMIEARGLATKRQTRTYLTVVVLMCLAGSPGASAQQKPAVDVAAGFQIQPWFGDTDREPSLAGWFVSAARNTGGRGAMEFEYAHGRSDYSFQTVHGLHVVDYDAHSFAAGYRYRLRLGRARPFVRLLAGLSIISDAQGRPGRLSSREKGGFVLQPGAGIDIPVAGRAALRLQADLWHFRYYRFSAGLSFGLGSS